MSIRLTWRWAPTAKTLAGITDKMTSAECMRMAEALNAKVVIPVSHDIWSNFQADPQKFRVLWRTEKDRLKYGFKPFIGN